MGFDTIGMMLFTAVCFLIYYAMKYYRRLLNRGTLRSGPSPFNIFYRTSAVIDWGWTQPMQVGETMSFSIKFYGLASTPRNVSDVKNLKIEITKSSLTIAHVEEIVEDEENEDSPQISNEIKVSFTVRASGVYKIAIFEDGKSIAGSPHEKTFIPGPPATSHTTLVRTLNSMALVAITKNRPYEITVEPRDEYGNLCACRLHRFDLREKFSLMVTKIGEDNGDPVPVSTDLRLSFDNITVDLFVPVEGCFHAVASYEGGTILNGEFDLIVLTEAENDEVKENIKKKNLQVWYEAKLLDVSQDNFPVTEDDKPSLSRTLSAGDMAGPSVSAFGSFRRRLATTSGVHSKAKSVYCYITPKQLVVKEFYFKIFPRRLQSFRLCQATKITVISPKCKGQHPVITISDNCQPMYTLSCPKSYIFIATFIGILNKNIGGSDSFEDKVKYFQQQLLSHHNVVSRFSRDRASLTIRRNLLVHDSYKLTKHFGVKDWLKLFQITFQGEMGVDWGGLAREWVTQLCKTMFVPGNEEDAKQDGSDLFRRMKDDNQALVLPNPNSVARSKLKIMEFAGKVVGKCLLEGCFGHDNVKYVTARFGRSFLAQIIGLAVTFKHFENDDPELYKSKVRYIIENDVSDFDLYFAEEEYSPNGKLTQIVPLKPNGTRIRVTDENKLEYLNRLAQYRLSTSIKDEIDAFNKGLNLVVPEHLLNMFDENELELLMCGSSEIDVDDMKKYCNVYDLNPPFARIMQWFWVVVSSFTQEELGMLLQFITGCSQLPPGGFADLSPRLKITFRYYQTNSLPCAHTCFNELCLPSYDSYERLHKMLKIAIKEGAVGFGMT